MTMVFLANVPSTETDTGMMYYTPFAHVSMDNPVEGNPCYLVIPHDSAFPHWNFIKMQDALEYVVKVLRAEELRANKFYI